MGNIGDASVPSHPKFTHPLAFPIRIIVVLDLRQQAFILHLAYEKGCRLLQQSMYRIIQMLGKRGINPEELPPSVDIKKLERRVKSQEKKIAEQSEKLPFDK